MAPDPHTPPLAERQKPGLSVTLPYPRRLDTCQGCGVIGLAVAGDTLLTLERWRECDEWDQPTHVIVVLCAACRARLIDPHPRLYMPLVRWQPAPGAMEICDGCAFLRDLTCTHPAAKVNGGPGVELEYPPPLRYHVYCSGRNGRSGWRSDFPGPVTACAQRVEWDV